MIHEGQYIQHPNIAHGISVKVLRSLGGQLLYELPNGKHASISVNSPRGKELTVSDAPLEIPDMPIQGLTTNNEGKLPYIGVLRKGGEKQTKIKDGREYTVFGKDLNYYRFTSDDPTVTARFNAIFGETPGEITVQLPFQTTEENFDAWKEAWAAGGLVHRCDGVTMVRWQEKDGTFSDEPKPCDSHTKPERDRCKEVGRLKVYIRELGRMALVTVLTHSKHDIVNIHGALKVLEKQCGSLTGIPFVLKRKEVAISALEKGKRVTRKKWLIHIEPSPAWAERLIEAQAMAALPSVERLQLNAAPEDSVIDDEWDDDEWIEDVQPDPPASIAPACDTELAAIRAIGAEVGADWGKTFAYFKVKSLEELTVEQARDLLAQLTKKRAAVISKPKTEAEMVMDAQAPPKPNGLDQWLCTKESGSIQVALDLIAAWKTAVGVIGTTDDDMKEQMKASYGVDSRKNLSWGQAKQFIGELQEMTAKARKAAA